MIDFRIVIGMLIILCILGLVLIFNVCKRMWVHLTAFLLCIGLEQNTSINLAKEVLDGHLESSLIMYNKIIQESIINNNKNKEDK